ncbi:MAG: hypothetical protein H6625_05685 [Bdellovibrionaceae bacterium]|nr:hypothetical protein [Pseudobdellovibrionaceae bacterium]
MKINFYNFARLFFIVLTVFGISKSIEWVFLLNNYHGWILFTYYCVELFIFIKGRPAKIYGHSAKELFVPLFTVSTIYLFNPEGDVLIGELVSSLFFILGYSLLFVSLLTIGKSFDVTPSLKKIITKGIYKYIRHPMYLAYIFLNIQYLLSVYSFHNFCVLWLFLFCMFVRIKIEEDFLLNHSEEYKAYTLGVKYKLFPYIY